MPLSEKPNTCKQDIILLSTHMRYSVYAHSLFSCLVGASAFKKPYSAYRVSEARRKRIACSLLLLAIPYTQARKHSAIFCHITSPSRMRVVGHRGEREETGGRKSFSPSDEEKERKGERQPGLGAFCVQCICLSIVVKNGEYVKGKYTHTHNVAHRLLCTAYISS